MVMTLVCLEPRSETQNRVLQNCVLQNSRFENLRNLSFGSRVWARVLTTVAVVSCVWCVLNVRRGLTDDTWTASLEYECVLALRFERPRETCLLQYLRFGGAFWKISTWPYMCHFFRIYHRIDRLPGCILSFTFGYKIRGSGLTGDVPSWCLSGLRFGPTAGSLFLLRFGCWSRRQAMACHGRVLNLRFDCVLNRFVYPSFAFWSCVLNSVICVLQKLSER